MNKNKVSRIFPIVLIILIVVFAIFVLVSLGKMVFQGSSRPKKDGGLAVTTRDELLNTTANRAVRLTVRGPIVADENFRSYRVTITPNSRSMTVYSGYLSDAIDGVELDNNLPAYTEFVNALDKANVGRATAFEGEADNINGICATGTVTELDILRDNESIYHVWTSTCSGSKGSLGAHEPQVRSLFLNQIPNHTTLIAKYGR